MPFSLFSMHGIEFVSSSQPSHFAEAFFENKKSLLCYLRLTKHAVSGTRKILSVLKFMQSNFMSLKLFENFYGCRGFFLTSQIFLINKSTMLNANHC